MLNILTNVVPIDVTQYVTDIMSDITSLITPAAIVGVIGAIVGSSLVFVFLWWGTRKGFSALMSAIQKGKAKL